MLLLDTHTFYWFITDDDRLSREAKSRIETSAEIVYVSAISFWEMAIKENLGKLRLPVPIEQMMDECEEMGFTLLPIKKEHLAELKNLPFIHRDPFDRLLICQARAEKSVLVTTDKHIGQYDVETFW